MFSQRLSTQTRRGKFPSTRRETRGFPALGRRPADLHHCQNTQLAGQTFQGEPESWWDESGHFRGFRVHNRVLLSKLQSRVPGASPGQEPLRTSEAFWFVQTPFQACRRSNRVSVLKEAADRSMEYSSRDPAPPDSEQKCERKCVSEKTELFQTCFAVPFVCLQSGFVPGFCLQGSFFFDSLLIVHWS